MRARRAGRVILDEGLAAFVGAVAAVAHVAIAGSVTVHALLYKRNVGAAVSWIGIAWLSPFLGGLLYAIMGVNRVKRRAQRLRRDRLPPVSSSSAAAIAVDPLSPLEYAVGRLTGLPSVPGNTIEMLRSATSLPDVVLTDIEMPRMDGYELLAALKANEVLARLPVAMITSRAGEKHRRKAIDNGAADYLTKPYSDEQLLAMVRRMSDLGD